MSTHALTLLEQQKLFFEAIHTPLAGKNREQTVFEHDILPVLQAQPHALKEGAKILRSTKNVPAQKRIEIYQRQYWYRVLDSIDEDFPQLKAYLGEKIYWEIIEKYLLLYRSKDYTMRHLGQFLSSFIASSKIISGQKKNVASVITEVQYAQMQAFEKREQKSLLQKNIESSKIQLKDHVLLICPTLPLTKIQKFLAIDTESLGHAGLSIKENACIAVWRDTKYRVHTTAIPNQFAPLLKAMHIGGTLKDLIKSVDPQTQPIHIQHLFSWMQTNGLLT